MSGYGTAQVRFFCRRHGSVGKTGIKGGLKMKKILTVCLSSLLLGAAVPAMAQTNANAPEAVVSATTTTVKGTVESINPITRTITVRSPEGTIVKLKAGKEIRNFEQLKKGDVVTVNYHQATAVALAKPGEPITEGAAEVVLAPEKGGDLTRVRTVQTTEVVQDIDSKKRIVTLKDADGDIHKVKVDEKVQNLDQIKKGDEIVLKSTEAIAISVAKPGR
jgi:hypothetical protein